MPLQLIVGLGNPGSEYAHTRHNLGFMVLDHIAAQKGLEFDNCSKFFAQTAEFHAGSQKVILAKPTTFMNESGQAVLALSQFYKIEPQDIWVVSDDLDLEFGTVRVRQGGSSGGHNGLKSIIEKIGEDFVRFRIGIKNPTLGTIDAKSFVLQRFNQEEEAKLPNIIEHTDKLIKTTFAKGVAHSSSSLE